MLLDYQRIKEGKINSLKSINRIIEGSKDTVDLTEIKRQIDNDIQALKGEDIRIVVIGTFGSGKTTFIKGLLDIDFLPTAAGENSSTVVYFRAVVDEKHTHKTSSITLNLHNERKIDLTSEQTGSDLKYFLEKQQSIDSSIEKLESNDTFNAIKKYLNSNDIEYIEKNGWDPARDVYSVDVWLNNEILKKGITLVDTPGTGSITPKHEDLTIHEIGRSSAFIYLFDAHKYGTASELNFLRRIWAHRKKSMFVFNKADQLYTDKANTKDAEVNIETFINNIPVDLEHDNLPRFIPLSTLLMFGTEKEKKLIMEDLNENYSRKNKNARELSNYDSVIKAIDELVKKVVNDGGTNSRLGQIDPKIYIERINEHLNEVLKDLKSSDHKSIENKIDKLKSEISSLESESQNISFNTHTTEERIGNLTRVLTNRKDELLNDVNLIYKNDIAILSYDDFKKRKELEPISVIKTKFDRSKKEIESIIKTDIIDYIDDVVNRVNNNDSLINLKEQMKEDVRLNFSLIGDVDHVLKEFEPVKEGLQNKLDALREQKNKIIETTLQQESGKVSTEVTISQIDGSIRRMESILKNLGAPPQATIIRTQESYLKEKAPFWRNDIYGIKTKETVDYTPVKQYNEAVKNIGEKISDYEEMKREQQQLVAEKEQMILTQKERMRQCEETINEIKGELINLNNVKNIKIEDTKRKEVEKQLSLILNNIIIPIEDWFDQLMDGLDSIYRVALDSALEQQRMSTAKEIFLKTEKIRELNDNLGLQSQQKKDKEDKINKFIASLEESRLTYATA